MRLLRHARRRLYLAHHNADIDSLSSAYLLSRTAPGDVAVAGRVRPETDIFRARLGLELSAPDQERLDRDYDLVVIVDSFDWEMVRLRPSRFVLIDHHPAGLHRRPGAVAASADRFIHAEAGSCSWLIYTLLRRARVPISREMALAALCGYYMDGGFDRDDVQEALAVARMMAAHDLTLRDAREAMEPLTLPDPLPLLAVVKAGQVLTLGGRKVFTGSVRDVGDSYAVRRALHSLGFFLVLMKLDMPGHRTIVWSISPAAWRSGVGERWLRAVRSRFADAVHWPSGMAPDGDLDGALSACIDLLARELER